jgi:hypothetical protein
MEYIVHNGHTHFAGQAGSWTKVFVCAAIPCKCRQRYGGDHMIWGTESPNGRNDARFIEQLSQLQDATTLIEVSVAALTTEPDLRDVGRSLISLARYYTCKKLGSEGD